MWKGYDLPRGKMSELFKTYLRVRNFYFEPSQNFDYVHFEVENPDEYVEKWLKNMDKQDYDDTLFVYEFPEGTTQEDLRQAVRSGLKYLGKAEYKSGAKAYFIEGTLSALKIFADEYLGGYELHPAYLCPSDEFAGIKELKSGGYFDDVEDYDMEDKECRLQGSKLKDGAEDSRIISGAQKQIDIQENRIYDCYDEDGNWKRPYSKMEQIEVDADEKASALCYLILAYGGTPKYSPGINGGIPMGYDGPVQAGEPKDYPVSFKNDDSVIKMCQLEMDRLVDDVISPLYYDEEADEEIDDWYTPEGQKISRDASKKLTALANVIVAYGGTPYLDDGFLGAYGDIKGDTKLRYGKDRESYLKTIGKNIRRK